MQAGRKSFDHSSGRPFVGFSFCENGCALFSAADIRIVAGCDRLPITLAPSFCLRILLRQLIKPSQRAAPISRLADHCRSVRSQKKLQRTIDRPTQWWKASDIDILYDTDRFKHAHRGSVRFAMQCPSFVHSLVRPAVLVIAISLSSSSSFSLRMYDYLVLCSRSRSSYYVYIARGTQFALSLLSLIRPLTGGLTSSSLHSSFAAAVSQSQSAIVDRSCFCPPPFSLARSLSSSPLFLHHGDSSSQSPST